MVCLLLLLHKMALLPKVVSVALQLMPDVWLWVAVAVLLNPAVAVLAGVDVLFLLGVVLAEVVDDSTLPS